MKKTCGEFLRYIFVCGFAFVADFGTLIGCREVFFKNFAWGVYAAVLLGFAVGHVANYLLSLWFVFKDEDERKRGWTWTAFLLFSIVGGIGAGITEFGMWIGFGLLHLNYVFVKLFMAGVVVVWNFFGRKLIVSRRVD